MAAGAAPIDPTSVTGPISGNTTSSSSNNIVGAKSSKSTFVMTDGWYVAIACIGGVLVANTKFGGVAFGILTLALIYQTSLLLQGK